MTFSIRPAKIDDIPAITAIYAESVINGTASYELVAPGQDEMARRFEANTRQGYPFIVAEDSGGIILGYAYASAFRTRPAYRWLVEDSIYLAPSAQGKGIGRALLERLLRLCEELGFRQMVAVIGGASAASVRLHGSLGFELTGTLRGTGFKHGRWLDTVLMQKALGDGNRTDPDQACYPGTLFGG